MDKAVHINDGRPFEHLPIDMTLVRHVQEERKSIGGVGNTWRWSLVTGDYRAAGATAVLFTHISDAEAFTDAAHACSAAIVAAVGPVGPLEDASEHGVSAEIVVVAPWRVFDLVVRLATASAFSYCVEDETREVRVSIGVERFDRSHFSFWNQNEATAAPKQSWYKWNMSWLPAEWNVLPFTWCRLCANLSGADARELPEALRFHLLRTRVLELRERARRLHVAPEDADEADRLRDRLWRAEAQLAARRVPTPPLTHAQTEQLLWAHYVLRFLPHLDGPVCIARDICRAYILHGYAARLFGPYRQLARHVGHGSARRKFRHMPQYELGNLSLGVLNRTVRADGRFVGRTAARRSRRLTNHKHRRSHHDAAYMAQIRRHQIL